MNTEVYLSGRDGILRFLSNNRELPQQWNCDKSIKRIYMALEIVTKEDLEQFRIKLLDDIKVILLKIEKTETKKWLRSHDVRKMLDISPGTLQNLCINKVLNPTKIRGINFYKYEEIEKTMNKTPDHHKRS